MGAQNIDEQAVLQLRPIDVKPATQSGRRVLVLADPLELAGKSLVLPIELAPLLQLCDGTRNASALRASLAVRYGLPMSQQVIERVVAALDDALLLENDRYWAAAQEALVDFRAQEARCAIASGESYPNDPDKLAATLDECIERVGPVTAAPRAAGLISPHIDYGRGADVYARVWAAVSDAARDAEIVVVLGTDHAGTDGALTLTQQRYATPYGASATDIEIVDALAAAIGEDAAYAEELHHRTEHSIELAVVWLHHICRGALPPLVPVLCGSLSRWFETPGSLPEPPAHEPFLGVLAEALSGRRSLIVASGDLSHVGPAFGGPVVGPIEQLVLRADDEAILDACAQGDVERFWEESYRVRSNNVCGLAPIYLALRLLHGRNGKRMGYQQCPADSAHQSWVSITGLVWE